MGTEKGEGLTTSPHRNDDAGTTLNSVSFEAERAANAATPTNVLMFSGESAAQDPKIHENEDPEKQSQASEGSQIVDNNTADSDSSDPESELVDFDGPDDPANPYNWSLSKKWAHGGILAYVAFITPVASTMFAPGVPQAMREFGTTNQTLGSLVVSIYLLGNAFGPLFIAPLSELYGRNPAYHVSTLLFVVFTIACAVSSSFSMLIGFRFLAGIVGSTSITIGSASIADMFVAQERGAAMAIWAIGGLLGPVVGPVAGGYLAGAKGWRWVFWLLTILGGAGLGGQVVILRETYAPILLERKATKLRKETGKDVGTKIGKTDLTPAQFMIRNMVRPMRMLALSPIVLLMSLYMAVVYGYLYLLFTTMTSVFHENYGFSSSNVGLAYLGIGVGMFIGLGILGRTSDPLIKKLAERNNGVLEPEYRLPPMIPAALIIPAGLFLYGWTAQYHVHWVAPIIGTSLVGFGLITTFMPTLNYLVDAYTRYAASVTAANTVLRALFGATLPLAGPKMYAALHLGWGNSLLAFIALGLAPIPMIFWKFGKKIRARTTATF